MNTPITKHPKYTDIIGHLIKLIADDLGCELQVYYSENINVVFANIEEAVLCEYDLSRDELYNSERKNSHPRYVMAYLLKQYTQMPDAEIARRIKRDRSTAIYGWNEIRWMLEKEDPCIDKINNCITRLKAISK